MSMEEKFRSNKSRSLGHYPTEHFDEYFVEKVNVRFQSQEHFSFQDVVPLRKQKENLIQ